MPAIEKTSVQGNVSFFKRKRGYAVLGLVLALGVSSVWYHRAAVAGAARSADARAEAADTGDEFTTLSGGWGELQCRLVSLEQPAEYIAFDKNDWSGPFWHIAAPTESVLKQSLLQAGCDEGTATKLLATKRSDAPGQWVLKPDDETILGLKEEVRSRLYLLLADNPLNRGQAAPLYVPKGDVERVFQGKFDPARNLETWARHLSYKRNGYVYFSDMEVLARVARLNEEERATLRRAVSATPVVMARLKVGSPAGLDSVVNYWGFSMPGVLVKDIRPLFDAQLRSPGGGAVSILYVLPPLARAKLYTTPLTPKADEPLPDCHFTALNFFSESVDPQLSNQDYATRYLSERYYQIGAPGRPGDLVVLVDAQNRIVHSATYLAGDVVYTKNGINLGQPWVLMHLDDMLGCYSVKETVRVGYMRKRTS